MKIKICTTIFLLMAGIQPTSAEVCYESGIYVSTHADIQGIGNRSSIFSLPLERTYNSSALQPRMFGLGWGTIYETVLSVTDSGIIIIQDGGSGKKFFYALKSNLSGAQKETKIQLRDDCSFSNNSASHDTYVFPKAQQKLKHSDIYQSRLGCSGSYIQKDSDGYKRTLGERTEFFDLKGRLHQITNKTGDIIFIHRNEVDRISKISDNKGHALTFDYSVDGFVTCAQQGNKIISYSYQGKNLVQVDREYDALNYTYNNDNLLTKVVSHQEAIVTIGYDVNDRVSSVQLYNDTLLTYQYLDKTSPFIEVGYTHGLLNTEFLDNQQLWQRTVLYARETNKYGLNYVSHMLKKSDLGQEETLYQECGLPVADISKKEKVLSQYNDDCQLVMQNNGKTIKKLHYDKKHQKIRKIIITDLENNITTWSRFTYDDRGKLIRGKTSEGLEAHLTYDHDNRITSMIDQKGEVLSYEYNDAGQPTLIAMTEIGKLVISYNEAREITNVDVVDGKGHEVNEKIFDTMQNLLHIIKPTGVDIFIGRSHF